MKRLALALLLCVGCRGLLSPTQVVNIDSHNHGTPSPSPSPTPSPTPAGFPAGAPCSDNIQCASRSCVAGFCQ